MKENFNDKIELTPVEYTEPLNRNFTIVYDINIDLIFLIFVMTNIFDINIHDAYDVIHKAKHNTHISFGSFNPYIFEKKYTMLSLAQSVFLQKVRVVIT